MSIIIDLRAAGLTHVTGKSDRCDGKHEVPDEAIAELDIPGLVDTEAMGKALQALHEQAHPEGTVYWENCHEPGCIRAGDVMEGRE